MSFVCLIVINILLGVKRASPSSPRQRPDSQVFGLVRCSLTSMADTSSTRLIVHCYSADQARLQRSPFMVSIALNAAFLSSLICLRSFFSTIPKYKGRRPSSPLSKATPVVRLSVVAHPISYSFNARWSLRCTESHSRLLRQLRHRPSMCSTQPCQRVY